ncbi:MAG: TIGR04255 family protein [Planctomycetaceae bacterium]
MSFASQAESVEWDWGQTAAFLDALKDEFELPIREAMQIPEPVVEKVDGSGFPTELRLRKVPKYQRIRNEAKTKVVQVGENDLVVSQMRDENGNYAGFTPLRSLFTEVAGRFRESIPVGDIATLEVHYVDMVRLKIKGKFDLRDYFDGAPEPRSTPYGHSFSTGWSLKFRTPDCGDTAELSVQSLQPDDGFLSFRLDWHRSCYQVGNDPESIAVRLLLAHTYLKECFAAMCLPPVWNSFEPLN